MSLKLDGTGKITGIDQGLNVVGVGTFSSNLNVNGDVVVGGGLTVTGDVVVGGGLTVTGVLTYEDVTNVDSIGIITARGGVRVTGGYSALKGVLETVSAATTYISNGALVLELDVQNGGTTYTYTNTGGNIGIVSFKNLPADTQNGTVITLIHTQNSSTPSGVGNTTAATGIGTNCTIIPYVGGSPIAGISTRGLVGSATTVTLSETAGDRDFVSFFVHYNGGTTSDLTSYEVYVTKNGGFRQGNIGI